MTDNITVQISGTADAVLDFLAGLKRLHTPAEQPQPWWKTETPWFERYGKLTAEEAADLEESTYGKGLHLEEWQVNAITRIYGDDAVTVPVKFVAGKFVR